MSQRMYLTSRRAAAVAVSAGVLLFVVLHRKGDLVHQWRHRQTYNAEPTVIPTANNAINIADVPLEKSLARRDFAVAPAAPVALDATSAVMAKDRWAPGGALGPVAGTSRMLVRMGGASIEVASIDSAVPEVRALATTIGGFVANSSVQAGRNQVKTATLEVKAPAQDFDRLISGLGPLGKVESVNVSAQDVGEEYVDVEARIANDHRLEARLIELLATRTGKLKDVLDVEQELARVRQEIERYEGRLRYLQAHAELSSLTITVHEAVPIIDHVSTNPIVAATREAWRNFIDLVAFVVASLGIVIPIGAVAGTLWYLFGRKTPVTGDQRPAVGN
jgi:hypothetical protein